jgi:tetratricopeptide (TPR) repeat protein
MQPRSGRRSVHPASVVRAAARLAVASLACSAAAGAAPTGPPPSPPPAAQLSASGSEAAALYARGDLAAAIAKLEATAPAARTSVDRSLLGALYYEAGRFADAWSVLEPLTGAENADPAVLYHAGRTALALGRRRVAASLLERSVQMVPQSPAARELGLLAGQMGRYEQAFALLGPWSQRNPEDLVAVRAAAAAALRVDRPRDAELLLRALPADDWGGILMRGQLALRLGQPQQAVDALAGLFGSHPPEIDIDLRRLLADGHIQLGSSDKAIPLVAPCASADPRCALLLAEAHYRSGDIATAITALELHAATALKDPAALPPDTRGRLAQMHGRLLVAAARYAEALPYLELASEQLPDEPLSWKSLGDALAALGRRDEALRAMERFRAASETANAKHKQLDSERQNPTRKALQEADELVAAGQGDAALRILRREIALDPANLVARLGEIQLLLRLERLDEALAAAETAVTAFPTEPDARYTRGIVHMARRDLAAAEADFVTTLGAAPGHVPALNDYAVLLMNAGRREQARILLERALALNPQDALAARNLKVLEGESPP